ncbi:MAG: hypothetical protein AB1633_03030 [Elusimicrobiota bacterium]
MITQLRSEVAKLLKEKKIDIVIGYEKSTDQDSTTPCFVETEKELEKLVWNESCVYNLSCYLPLTRNYNKVNPAARAGIVAKGCDVKSIVVLIQERQIKREDVVIIGMECYGVKINKKLAEKCKTCKVNIPGMYDILIKNTLPAPDIQKTGSDLLSEIKEIENKSPEERWMFWQKQFEKCIRCYACRQICPMCYCRECIVDCNIPQWILPSTSANGNFAWNIVRAYHLAGRCTGCGECDRACPVGIPLSALNEKLVKEIKELFDYESGADYQKKPALDDFRKEDKEDFIR